MADPRLGRIFQLVRQLEDLKKQATVERSHFYVAKTVTQTIGLLYEIASEFREKDEADERPASMMAVYYDTQLDTADIALRGSIGPGETAHTETACDGRVNLHFNAAGHLIAIELRDMAMLHPDLARDAIQMRPIREGDL